MAFITQILTMILLFGNALYANKFREKEAGNFLKTNMDEQFTNGEVVNTIESLTFTECSLKAVNDARTNVANYNEGTCILVELKDISKLSPSPGWIAIDVRSEDNCKTKELFQSTTESPTSTIKASTTASTQAPTSTTTTEAPTTTTTITEAPKTITASSTQAPTTTTTTEVSTTTTEAPTNTTTNVAPTITSTTTSLNPSTGATQTLLIGETVLTNDTLITTLAEIACEYTISFELYPNILRADSGYENILHFTQDGDLASIGDRIPAIWKNINTKGLHICSSVNGIIDRCIASKPITEKQWNQIKVSQQRNEAGQSVYKVEVNGFIELEEVNTTPQVFTDVKVYASDPWYDVHDGTIRNLTIWK